MDRSSSLVAFGILCSRLTGFIRQRFFAQYFGLSDSADAFMAAFRIPNFLQNLFGEGALSASFIPVYAALVAREEREEAARVAGAVAALLALITGILVLLGVLATPLLVTLIAPGFEGDKRQLTIAIVRILFPGAGLLVLSAWCLGILNSHRRFLLSYIAPVTWNVSMIVALVWWGRVTPLPRLAVILAFAALAGSALQMLVQLPTVLKLVPNLRFRLELSEHVRATVRTSSGCSYPRRGSNQCCTSMNAGEPLAHRGRNGPRERAASLHASCQFVRPGGVGGSAAGHVGRGRSQCDGRAARPREHRPPPHRILRRTARSGIPHAGRCRGCGALSDRQVHIWRRVYVWESLPDRQSGFWRPRWRGCIPRRTTPAGYATPLRFALVHVGIATVLGYLAAIVLPPMIGIEPVWGTVGLTTAASIAGWVELLLLRRSLNRRIGHTGLPGSFAARLWSAAFVAAAVAWAIKLRLPEAHPVLRAALILLPFGAMYLGLTVVLGVAEARRVLARVRR